MENFEKSSKNPSVEDSIVKSKLKNERKRGTTRGAVIAGTVGLFILLVAGAILLTHYKKEFTKQTALMEDQRVSYTRQVTQRDSIINEWLVTFDEIEKDLNMIKQKEKVVTLKSNEPEFSKNRKDQILGDLRYINTLLDNNRKKIASLSAQLNNSGGTIKGLQARVTSLEGTIKQYEADVTELKANLAKKDFEMGQMNNKMTEMEASIAQKDEKITEQTNKMNDAYLASGTYKELKSKGLVSKTGGFLGLGSKGTLSSDFNDNLFAKVDIRDTKTIPVNSKDAKLITKHPSSSYTMVREANNKISYIEIKDPENFWKISKYAVVEIIK